MLSKKESLNTEFQIHTAVKSLPDFTHFSLNYKNICLKNVTYRGL